MGLNHPTESQWAEEVSKFADIHANYAVDHIPLHVEDSLIRRLTPLGYKFDVQRAQLRNDVSYDSSLRRAMFTNLPTTLDLQDPAWGAWRTRIDNKISELLRLYGGNPSVITFYAGHENEIAPWGNPGDAHPRDLSPNYMLAHMYLGQQWNARVPDVTKKLYYVGGQLPSQWFNLSHFLDSVQARMYCYEPGYIYKRYDEVDSTIQQRELDSLRQELDYAMDVFKYRSVEMWACLQAHQCADLFTHRI